MKKIILTAVAALAALTPVAANDFGKHFADSTLRLDYIFGANPAGGRHVLLAGQSSSKNWAGRRHHLKTLPLLGNGVLTVRNEATGDTLFATSYSSLYSEWLSTPEAETTAKAFEHTVLVPYPREAALIDMCVLNNRHDTIAKMTHRFDPADILIVNRDNITPVEHRYIHKGGSVEDAIDVAIMAEGYTKAELDSFYVHAQTAVDAILAHEPFKSLADRFNFVAVGTESLDSGVSIPRLGEWKRTALGSSFSTFYSDRYLTSLNLKTINDALTGIPYEHIIILANTDEYGGGGIYNSYTLTTAKHFNFRPVVVHEFGHSFGGLGDEYFYEGPEDQTYPVDVEPWEPNITTLVDFDSKWKDMLPAGAAIPTPASESAGCTLGVIEGGGYKFHGIYRPADDCRMRTNKYPRFCDVCTRSLDRLIRFYTEE